MELEFQHIEALSEKIPSFKYYVTRNASCSPKERMLPDTDVELNLKKLTLAELEIIAEYAEENKVPVIGKDIKTYFRVLEGDYSLKLGKFSINELIFEKMLNSYFEQNSLAPLLIFEDGCRSYAELLTSVDFRSKDSGRGRDEDEVWVELSSIECVYNSSTEEGRYTLNKKKITLKPHELRGKTIFEVFTSKNYRLADAADCLMVENAQKDLIDRVLAQPFKQLRVKGSFVGSGDKFNKLDRNSGVRDKCINVTTAESLKGYPYYGSNGEEIPIRPEVYVFSLRKKDFKLVNVADLEDYVYNKKLSEKLILADDHRKILDVMTSNLDFFSNDIIEGKCSSNIILCMGTYGVGKTTTAEVYSELKEMPLYSVKSSELGTTIEKVSGCLTNCFDRCKKWGALMLLDEADVFLAPRGKEFSRDVITSEFLKVLEYSESLMFMTTNSKEIDEGIKSRCLLVLQYKVHSEENLAKVWRIQFEEHKIAYTEELISELIRIMVGISARDTKMLLKAATKMAHSEGVPVNIEHFKFCAPYKGITLSE